MDIKPFVSSEFNVFTEVNPAWIIVFVVSALVIGAAFYFKNRIPDMIGAMMVIFGVMGVFVGGPMGMVINVADAETEAYQKHQQEFKIQLNARDFYIISGTPDLHPNKQSAMLLEYGSGPEAKTYDCTLFTPEDVTRSIVFSCGEAKLTLEDIQKSVDEEKK